MKLIRNIFRFYVDGFKNMPAWGRTAWAIIVLKGVIIFILIKFLLFPNFLKKNFETDEERSDYVLEQLTKKADNYDVTER
ncbi:MAG: DUF4492 domain-containing protein [Bacteroidales bacterium]|nr:DUF4492 domain-containing protein [Bacteroidales bacterium]HOY39245.1 DUF4492 domain-containing protein [Bacteroidales bacterium]HQP04220.1 DUF4492 domain-containing protein [Bacteroidales bacterium]